MTDLPAGIHPDISEVEYHCLPGLSSTGIKALLDSPARYQWELTHRTEKKAFDLGHVVHALVLGVGLDVEVIDAPDWRTKAAREAREAARDAGRAPILQHDYAQAEAAAHEVLKHPDAGPLFTGGVPEASILWDDADTGVRCRGRLDYFHERAGVCVDLKTVGRSADPRRFGRHAAEFGYAEQAVHYQNGVEVLTGRRPRFIHALVELDRPNLVSVDELDAEFLAVAAERVRHAIDLYAECAASGEWPGFELGIHRVSPPRWYVAQEVD